jgi:integrase
MHGGSLCGHVHDLGGDKWELVANLPRRPGEARGRRQTRRIDARGVKRARSALAAWLAELEQHDCTDPGRITLGEVLRRWLETEAPHNARPKTLERYRELVTLHLTSDLGEWLVCDLRAADLSTYYDQKQVTGRLDGTGGLSAQTARHLHAVIRTALTWAEEEDLVTVNPARRVKHPPRAQRGARAVWTPLRISEAIAAASRNRVRIPAALAGWCGLRRSEVCGLRWSDLDLAKRILTVDQSVEQTKASGGPARLHFGRVKTFKAHRAVPIPRHLADLLVAHKHAQDEMRLAGGSTWNVRGLVCCRPDGEPTRPESLTAAWREFVACHGLEPRLDFHGLRRSYLSGLHDRGASDRVLIDWGGHESVQTTHDHYTASFDEAAAEAVRRLDEAIDGAEEIVHSRGEASEHLGGAVLSMSAAKERRRHRSTS